MAVDLNVLVQKPLMIVISGPSGVGKDSIIHALLQRKLPIHFVVTVNTRHPRPDEKEGIDYFFVSRERFQEMINQKELIEYSQVYEDFKGVPKSQVEQAFASGKDVIMRLDVQGAEKIRNLFPDALLIFLVPDNEEEWIERFKSRNGERPKDWDMRMSKVREELQKVPLFDYVVVNPKNKLDEAVDVVEAIIKVEHHRTYPRSTSF
jgi:guanylate kinase